MSGYLDILYCLWWENERYPSSVDIMETVQRWQTGPPRSHRHHTRVRNISGEMEVEVEGWTVTPHHLLLTPPHLTSPHSSLNIQQTHIWYRPVVVVVVGLEPHCGPNCILESADRFYTEWRPGLDWVHHANSFLETSLLSSQSPIKSVLLPAVPMDIIFSDHHRLIVLACLAVRVVVMSGAL